MSRGLFTLTSGMLTQQRKIEISSNNMANINTAGYKREQAVTNNFGTLLIHKLRQNGIYETAEPLSEVSLIRIMEDNNTYHSQGNLDETGGAFDFALVGEGFFGINNNGTILYGRNGSFNLDDEGYLIFADKGRVQGEYGDIFIGTDKYEAAEDGSIYVDGEQIDKIAVYNFDNYANLDKFSEGLYTSTDEANLMEDAVIKKGWIERSNVDLAQEMSDIIASQRALQSNSQALKMYDMIMEIESNQIGRIN